MNSSMFFLRSFWSVIQFFFVLFFTYSGVLLSATYGCSPFYVTCKKINTKNAMLCNAFDSQLAMHNINKYSSEECDKVFSRTLKYDQSPSTLNESYTHAFKIVDDFVKHFHIVCLWILNGIDFSGCLRMRLCVCLHFHLNVATNMLNYSCIWLTIGKIGNQVPVYSIRTLAQYYTHSYCS